MRIGAVAIAWLDLQFDRQRGGLVNWIPVFLGVGIGVYLALKREPSGWFLVGGALAGLGALVLGRYGGAARLALFGAPGIVALGFALAGARAHHVAAPVLEFRYYGPVEGRVVALDRSLSDRPRITLDRVVLAEMAPADTPARVRIALHGEREEPTPEVGATVILTGHLSPPQGPAEPGGFDFQRRAWFQGLGAVGYTRSPVLLAAPPARSGPRVAITRLRMAISTSVQESIGGDSGGFAAAILTGERSGISRPAVDALRQSNLAHLLAISGLHMGLLTAFVFAVVRFGLAAVPPLALGVNSKKVAAVGAMAAGAFYLMLSGGSVATERAYVMVAMMLGAVLADRRALTLRAVALAATVVLLMRPESLAQPGFQMSFAATTALVVAFGALKDRLRGVPKPLGGAAGLFVSSAVAGAATAPFAAAHFNMVAHLGLVANLFAVPLMGTVVIPAAVLSALLAPFGLAGVGLWFMKAGIAWIMLVAQTVSALDLAVGHVPSPPAATLPLLALGGVVLVLWTGRLRWTGPALAALGFALWLGQERPTILIAGEGTIVGVMTDEGRALSKARGAGFVALSWLENDGDPADQAQAHDRWAVGDVIHLKARAGTAEVSAACRTGAVEVVPARARSTGCDLYDLDRLKGTGSVAIRGDKVITARSVSGARLWNTR